jgi:hypothetical protein
VCLLTSVNKGYNRLSSINTLRILLRSMFYVSAFMFCLVAAFWEAQKLSRTSHIGGTDNRYAGRTVIAKSVTLSGIDEGLRLSRVHKSTIWTRGVVSDSRFLSWSSLEKRKRRHASQQQ